MQVPEELIHRVVRLDQGEIRLVVDDDRWAARWVVGLGMVSVLTLASGILMGGPVWPWVGVASVPILAVVATATAPWLRHPRTLELTPDRWQVDGTDIAPESLDGVEIVGGELRFHGSAGAVRLPMGGEEDATRDALAAWLTCLLETPQPREARPEPPSSPERSER